MVDDVKSSRKKRKRERGRERARERESETGTRRKKEKERKERQRYTGILLERIGRIMIPLRPTPSLCQKLLQDQTCLVALCFSNLIIDYYESKFTILSWLNSDAFVSKGSEILIYGYCTVN